MQSKPLPSDEELLQKIRTLPPERVAEVSDFVDFLRFRDVDQALEDAATRLSEDGFVMPSGDRSSGGAQGRQRGQRPALIAKARPGPARCS